MKMYELLNDINAESTYLNLGEYNYVDNQNVAKFILSAEASVRTTSVTCVSFI